MLAVKLNFKVPNAEYLEAARRRDLSSGGGEAEPSGQGGVFLVLTPRRADGPQMYRRWGSG
jgi:hypothetical protein